MARFTLVCFLVFTFSAISYGYEFPKFESAKQYASSLVQKASSLVRKQQSKQSSTKDFEIDFDCKEDGLFSHPTDCRFYVRCSMGEPRAIECDSGRHFNNDTRRCEDPCSAQCDKNIQDCGWVTTETPEASAVSTEEIATEESSGELHRLDAVIFCPMRDGIDYFLPHPYDCNRYVQCVKGRAYLKRCPQEKHYSKRSQKCEKPCEAECDPNIHCSAASESTTEDSSSKVDKLGILILCPKGRWLTNYPGDCTRYISCYKGLPFVVKCPGNLHFHLWTKRCEPPCEARCDKTLQCKWRSFKTSFLKKQSVSDFDCSQDGTFPHPEDCGSYIVCSKGENRVMECPEGLHFNRESQICDRPFDAHCDSSLNQEYSWPESSTSEDAEMSPLKQPVFDFTCEHDGVFDNNHACESFIQCSYGDAYLINCPFGLHYNAEMGYCMPPCEAKCDPNYDCKDEEQTQSERRRLMDFSCETDGFHTNPLDCETFIQCFRGAAYEIDCPRGLHYSSERQICVAPCEAKCAPYYETYCNYENSETSVPRAPEYDFACTLSGIYQNPKDCGSYIKCEDNKAYTESCPPGLHYSEDTETCVKPCDAECDPSFATECGWDKPWLTENYPQSPEFSDFSAELSMDDHFLAQKYIFKCIHDSVYRHPGDCGKYIVCEHKIPHIMPCPDDLHWSVKDKRCVTPCEAHCNSSLATECGWDKPWLPESETQTIEPFDYTTEFSMEDQSLAHKYKFNCMHDGFYRHPEDCGKYVVCDGKITHTMDCPKGLHWSVKGKRCDWQCAAHCSSSLACQCGWPECGTDDVDWIETSEPDCQAPPKVGPCKARIPRYHYDAESGHCKRFFYGGCAGNSNSFQTERECMEMCKPKIPVLIDCEAEPDVGPCEAYIPRYYYDRESGQCKSFHYGGCQGNTNNFLSESECREKCQEKIVGDFECPSNNGKYGHYLDCLSYYHCKRGIPTLKKCPKGTAFDHHKSKCVTEHQAICVYKCEESDATYPHDEDCHKFIDCVNGVSKVEKCPSGKAFDPDQRDCIDERQVSTCHWS